MCDTMWKSFGKGGIFAKNSDRSCNEPNLVQFIPGGETGGAPVACTYISVPQEEKKYSVLLVRPSWIWGAEMGINEFGVVIGNEAVFTKSKDKKIERLLGMDILRIALERAENAKEGIGEIIRALTKFGQGGNCAFDKKFYYDNSYLVADKNEAYIIETAGYDYKTRKLAGYGNISNRLSIEEDNFAERHTNKLITNFAGALKRQNCACNSIKNAENIRDVFATLRTHDTDDRNKLYKKGSVSSVCMHQSMLGDHTTGSMVVDSREAIPVIWITGSSTPCLSVFKPVFFGQNNPPVFLDEKESLQYWLKREYLNRAIFAGATDSDSHIEHVRDMEEDFISSYEALLSSGAGIKQFAEFSKKCAEKEEAFINGYSEIIEDVKNHSIKLPGLWAKKTKKLGVNVFKTPKG